MTTGERVAVAALSLVDTPFRLHGRDPATGLDCIGLAAVAMRRAGLGVWTPRGYGLRNNAIDSALACVDQCDLVPAAGALAPGDLVLVRPGPAQHHLLITAFGGWFAHAHAGLRRVVAMPGPPAWPIERCWRPQRKKD